jgi:hypothetical protein
MSNKEIYELLKKAVDDCVKASHKRGYSLDYIVFPLERNGIDINTIGVYDETKDYETAFRALYHWNEYKSQEVVDQKDLDTDREAGLYRILVGEHYFEFDEKDFKSAIHYELYDETLKKYNLY